MSLAYFARCSSYPGANVLSARVPFWVESVVVLLLVAATWCRSAASQYRRHALDGRHELTMRDVCRSSAGASRENMHAESYETWPHDVHKRGRVTELVMPGVRVRLLHHKRCCCEGRVSSGWQGVPCPDVLSAYAARRASPAGQDASWLFVCNTPMALPPSSPGMRLPLASALLVAPSIRYSHRSQAPSARITCALHMRACVARQQRETYELACCCACPGLVCVMMMAWRAGTRSAWQAPLAVRSNTHEEAALHTLLPPSSTSHYTCTWVRRAAARTRRLRTRTSLL